MSLSAAQVCVTSDWSLTCNKLSLRRDDSFVSPAETIRSHWILLREDDLTEILEHWRAED